MSEDISITDLKEGQRVHYQPSHYHENKWENGIIKEIRKGRDDGVWVVYNCGGNWDRYKDYTGAMTNLSDIKIGWRK